MGLSVWQNIRSLLRSTGTLRPKDGTFETYLLTPSGRIWTAHYGSGPKAPLVVIHGGPGFPHDYLLTLKELTRSRPVIFYDQLGCGRSPGKPPDGQWSLPMFVEELECLLEKLCPDGAHLLGHSWGAALALEVTLRKAPVRSLTLASPFLSARTWLADAACRLASLPEAARARIEAGDVQEYYRLFVYGSHRYPELIAAAANGAESEVYQKLWGVNEIALNGALAEYEGAGRLGDVTCPVWYTCGRNDEVTPETLSQFAAQTTRAESKVFELSAHHPHLSEAKEYCAGLREFLERVETNHA